MKKEFWRDWKNKSNIEGGAIEAVRRAKRVLFANVPKEKIHAIYLKGSFARREMNKKSDVDFVPIVYENKNLNPILKLQEEQKKELKPVEIVPLSIWEIKNQKRYHARKEKGPKGAPSIDEFVRFRLIWGKHLNVCDFPTRKPGDRLRGLVKAWNNIFIPLYEKKVFDFDQIIKQIFWLTEYEQMAKGNPHTHTWKSLVISVKNKNHPVHDAWKYRRKPTKDKRVQELCISKMKRHLKKLENKKIIQGYKVDLDSRRLGRDFYSVKINLRDVSQIKDVKSFILTIPEVTATTEAIGSYDIKFDLEVENSERYFKILEDLETQFDFIREVIYFRVLKNYKILYMPEIEF